MKQPLISFIITYYNEKPATLSDCVRSVMALPLTSDEREVIVVDDGSELSMESSLRTLAPELVYIRQKNSGVSVARNNGLTRACGQFVQFVDGDDQLDAKEYGHVIGILRSDDVDLVTFDFADVKGNTHAKNTYAKMTGAEYMLGRNIHGSACSYVFDKHLSEGLTFSEGIGYGEDEEFTARILLNSERLCPTRHKAYRYMENPHSATRQNNAAARSGRLDDNIKVILRLNELTSSLSNEKKDALNRRVAQLSMDYVYNTLRFSDTRQEAEERIADMREKELFPLPFKSHTLKYAVFSILSRCKLMRLCMRLFIR